jgi:hypothetical protein
MPQNHEHRLRAHLAIALVASGCLACAGGARTVIVADKARYPVSLSRGIRDTHGKLVPSDRRLKVGALSASGTSWAMLWGHVPLSGDFDISDAVNAQVSHVGGEAVINLEVTSAGCPWFEVPLLSLLPFWPGCVRVELHGDIVQIAEEAPSSL